MSMAACVDRVTKGEASLKQLQERMDKVALDVETIATRQNVLAKQQQDLEEHIVEMEAYGRAGVIAITRQHTLRWRFQQRRESSPYRPFKEPLMQTL